MQKYLDNLYPRNFNLENPGFMLNHKIYIHAAKIPGIRYYYFILSNSTMLIKSMDLDFSEECK